MRFTDYGIWVTIFGDSERGLDPSVTIASLNLSKIGPPMNHVSPCDSGINHPLLCMVLAKWPLAKAIRYTINGQLGIIRSINLDARIKYLQSNGKLSESFTGEQVAQVVTKEFPRFYKHKSQKDAIIRYWERGR